MATGVDPYLSQLQSTLGQMMSGSMFPQTTSEVGAKRQRLTPEEEAAAYQTSGFGGLLAQPEYGQVPEAQLRGYYDLSQPYMFGTGMENINQILSQAGWAPGGSAGQAPAGTQAEMAARLKAQLGSQEAQALIQNAQQGAQARANLGANVAASRYGTLTVPNVFSMSMATKPGAGTTGVIQNPSTIGTGSNTYLGGTGGGGGGMLGGSKAGGAGGGAAGGGGEAGGSDFTSTYREPSPYELENWDTAFGNIYTPSNPYNAEYTDFWNQPGYPGGPQEKKSTAPSQQIDWTKSNPAIGSYYYLGS